MAIHPLVGHRLRVVRVERQKDGGRYILVEHPPGRQLRLPEAWTDRAPAAGPPAIDGRTVRLAAEGLLQLSRATAVALGRKLDKSAPGEILQTEAEHKRSNAANSRPASVERAATQGAGPAARGMGGADAQGTVEDAELSGGAR